ncbi:hypothetical protein BW14_06870 [Bifidobacterium sp. UTBIF-68]|uniref:hypothetical protein n=1 Tax=Bifidobacterium sp. UTBIF-68 TaxID=1465262 RepID=UPI00112E8274|nr:hypothetical protein [Bifidobacterium sp. UTBIF-68]TPF92881.1 hypothetical protein BW14_06870 [Bifidobacterium sp. UTBIF-68]
MAQLESLIPDDTEPGGDGVVLTRLANRLVNRIPMLCTLKTFYDGKETVPTKAVPRNMDVTSSQIYRRFVDICPMNLASTIANAVITSQKPTGFRLVADKTMRSTDADDMWQSSGMNLKSLNMLRDASLYGAAYAAVTDVPNPAYIKRLSPWDTVVSDDKNAAIFYSYNADEGMEYITLYRLTRNDDGTVANVYSRVARRESESRSLPTDSPDYEDAIYEMANNDSQKRPRLEPTFEWTGAASSDGYDFAAKCQCLPVVQLKTPTGRGQFEPHIRTLSAIDQQRFQRFCIQEMQAFKQRWVSGDLPEYYTKQDPAVKAGRARAGDKIDYSTMFELGPAALWLMPKDAKMGESSATDITPIISAANTDIKQLAGASGTPLSILSPDVSGSAEGAKLTTRMLRLKVQDMNARANDAFVLLLKMALTASNADGDAYSERFETMWEPVETPSDLDQAQAASYVKGLLPVKTIMRRFLNMSEMDIAEAMQDLQDTAFATALSRENTLVSSKTSQQSSPALDDALGSSLTLPDETLTAGGL